jgi:hypothetical protein
VSDYYVQREKPVATTATAASAATEATTTKSTAAGIATLAHIDSDAAALPLLIVGLGDGVLSVVAGREGDETEPTRASWKAKERGQDGE